MAKNDWAAEAIENLLKGETAQVRPYGKSMEPLVFSGQLVTLKPVITETELFSGDIVLVNVRGTIYLHKITAIIYPPDERFRISNNKGRNNGWVIRADIFGKCVKVEN